MIVGSSFPLDPFTSEGLIAIANEYVPKWLSPGKLSAVCGVLGLISIVAAISLRLTHRHEKKAIFLTAFSTVTALPSSLALAVSPKVGDLACIIGLTALAITVMGIYVDTLRI